MEFITMLDTAILNMLTPLQSPWMNNIMIFFSRLGNFGFIWLVLCVVLLCLRPTRRIGAAIALAMLFCFVFGNLLLKPMLARPRPFVVDPTIQILMMPEDAYSFPSGHTMHAFAATTALGSASRSWGAVALMVAILIAFSRLYLMVHYPTDILGGVILGVTGGLVGHALAERFIPLRRA